MNLKIVGRVGATRVGNLKLNPLLHAAQVKLVPSNLKSSSGCVGLLLCEATEGLNVLTCS